NLEGKVALVTGCRRGIGRAMAQALSEAGADIVGVSASLELGESDIEKDVRACGRSFLGFACDMADRTALYQCIQKIKREAPPIDILINNAGTTRRAPVVEHTDEMWGEVVEVNLTAQFILA